MSSRPMVLCVSNVSVTDNQSDSAAQEKKGQDDENDAQGNAKKTEVSVTKFALSVKLFWDVEMTKRFQPKAVQTSFNSSAVSMHRSFTNFKGKSKKKNWSRTSCHICSS